MIGPKGRIYLQVPIIAGIIDNFLKDFEEGFISCLCLTIALWEVRIGEAMMDVEGDA